MSVPGVRQRRLGWWSGGESPPAIGERALGAGIQRVGSAVYVMDVDGRPGVAHAGVATFDAHGDRAPTGFPLLGFVPALRPEQLGDPEFRATHGVRYAYVAGAMANGIASEEMVEAMARAGMLGFFGAAGLAIGRIEAAIDRIEASLGDLPYGFNLIHSPNEPQLESDTVDLYLRHQIRLLSASAYLDLTEPLIRYRVAGIHRDGEGRVIAPNRVVAKVSRVEVARRFFTPPPEPMLRTLVAKGVLTPQQAEMAEAIPVAEDLTAEADSGGHTDNRSPLTLLPTMLALRDELQSKFGYSTALRVGAAGGIATPASAVAAFAMGAAYILTGTINQACVEAGTSTAVREMWAEAGQADVIMAPAADMFEMGVKVQVLKRGTVFGIRARKLYDLYRTYDRLEDIPATLREMLARDYFRASLPEVWNETKEFFAKRDRWQIEHAEQDPKHKMALVFRWYLGQSSTWANRGEPSRKVDYQVWCGPAMGAFNEWVRGTFLERPENRDVVTVAMNLLVGAAALTRAGWLRAQGVPLAPDAQRFAPRPRAELSALVD
ncbi:MAG: PfaD family polyunsaturated fatty acid/polyketide biosynthesis protein [Phycisphaerae bacterium]